MSDAPLRVVEVLEATAGGTRRHLAEVVAALEHGGFELHLVVACRRDPDFERDVAHYRAAGHEVTLLPMTRGAQPLHDFRSVLALRRLLRRRACDLLHVHSAKAGALGRLAARGLGIPVVYSPHAFPFLQRDRAPVRGFYRMVERALAPGTHRLLAVSEAEGRLAVESGLYDEESVRVLPNALDVELFDDALGEVEPPHDPRVFGFAADLRTQKDPLLFVEAARRLRARGVGARFVLPAHGPMLLQVRRAVDRGDLTAECEFVPAEASLVELYRRIDIGVLPSLWEGLPYTMLEVLAMRRPLIASRLPVFEDHLAPLDDRLLFPPGDADALADRMATWASLPAADLEALGARGRDAVQAGHDAARWRDSLREILREAARS